MIAALGNLKEYTLKQYLLFAEKLQRKSTVGLFFNQSTASNDARFAYF